MAQAGRVSAMKGEYGTKSAVAALEDDIARMHLGGVAEVCVCVCWSLFVNLRTDFY